MKRATSLLLLLTLAFLQGCHTHASSTLAQLEPNASVRARVTSAKAEELSTVLGREDRVLTGRVIEQSPDRLLLQVPTTGAAPGHPLAQRVELMAADIVEVEVRRLDQTRTIGAVAALLAVGIAAAIAIFGGGEEAVGPDKPGTGVDEARIPVSVRP